MGDLRNPQARARDEYLESDSGRRACDVVSLIELRKFDIYLRNRIEMAFLAGWKACEDFHRDAHLEGS